MGSPDFQYHHSENSHLFSLKIPELFPEDSGIFTCEAFNDYGETFTSCSLFITCPGVRLISDVFKTFPKSVSVARGAPIVVFAELTPGCDRQVSWIKDQTLVDQTNANNIEQGRVQFSIVEAGPRDAGLYELLTVTMVKSIELPLLLMFCNDYYFVSSCDEFEFLNV